MMMLFIYRLVMLQEAMMSYRPAASHHDIAAWRCKFFDINTRRIASHVAISHETRTSLVPRTLQPNYIEFGVIILPPHSRQKSPQESLNSSHPARLHELNTGSPVRVSQAMLPVARVSAGSTASSPPSGRWETLSPDASRMSKHPRSGPSPPSRNRVAAATVRSDEIRPATEEECRCAGQHRVVAGRRGGVRDGTGDMHAPPGWQQYIVINQRAGRRLYRKISKSFKSNNYIQI